MELKINSAEFVILLLFNGILTTSSKFVLSDVTKLEIINNAQRLWQQAYVVNDVGITSNTCTLTASPPEPSSGCCGVESTLNILRGRRAVGAQISGLHKHPWMALIGHRLNSSVFDRFCSGFLISGKYVVTAPSCTHEGFTSVSIEQYVTILGEHTVSTNPDCVSYTDVFPECNNGKTIIPIERITVHSEYDASDKNHKNDIALIRLTQTAKYTDYIRPICLPASDVTVQPPRDLLLHFAGWGTARQIIKCPKHRTSFDECTVINAFDFIKRDMEIPYKSLEESQAVFDFLNSNTQLWNKQICAGGETGKSPCYADIGGPLMHKRNGVFEAVGIFSQTTKICGIAHVPGVFTKVFEYTDWIGSNIEP